MSNYTNDGGVLPSSVPRSQRRGASEHNSMFGIYRGIILETVYPEDPRNSNGGRVEYVVKVRGQRYPNALALKDAGGIYNYRERIKKHVEKSFTAKMGKSTYDENLDGEAVYVMFLEGSGDIPLVVGSAEHPRHAAYKKVKASDGLIDIEEFNGVEFSVDKDSNYLIKHVGRKDKEGVILNPAAVDSQIKMHGNGDVEINTHGTSGTGDLRCKFTKASKTFELYAQGNKIEADASGVRVTDKNGNSIVMNSGTVNVTSVGTCNVTASGAVNIQAGGNTFNGGVVTDNVINNDPITGIPLNGVGGITTS